MAGSRFADVKRLIRTSNLVLYGAIVDDHPESIRETADIVKRDYREVHRNLIELQELGVIEFEADGGRKRPILRGGSETVDFSFSISQDDLGDTPRFGVNYPTLLRSVCYRSERDTKSAYTTYTYEHHPSHR